jgi:hypothetical protein
MLMNYVQALLVQNSQTAMCNIRHTLLHRLARWLLLARDRLDSDLIPLTHELLSMMLGVRRAGITAALAQLEVAGALRKSRGTILIADPVELERHACECYRIIADEFARVVTFGDSAIEDGEPSGCRFRKAHSHDGLEDPQ